MTQYVSMKMEFGTDEYFDVFDSAVGKENVPERIGKPTLFVFAPNGEVVFAGSNGTSGIKIDDDFKQTLIQGISKTGRIARPPLELPEAKEFFKQLRKLMAEKKTLEAGEFLSQAYQEHTPQTGLYSESQLGKLSELTELELLPPSMGEKIDKQAMRLLSKAKKMVSDEIKSAKKGDKSADQAAVEIEKINQAFSGFSGTQTIFAQTWNRLEQQSGESGLQARAKQQIADAPQSEPAAAVPVESEVAETEAKVEPRTWNSSSGKFSVVATLIGVDGDQVRLKTEKKEIKVPLKKLSDADQEYLNSIIDEL